MNDYMAYRDFRAQERADNRIRKQKQKYYGYRGVKTSWVGQQYYDITLVSEDTIGDSVMEREHSEELQDILENHQSCALLWWYIPAHIEMAVHELKTSDTNVTLDALPSAIDIRSALEELAVQNPHMKLKVRTWTKQDNFSQKESFINGPDRRHSRGKRRIRERHLQKWHSRDLGRNMRSQTRTLRHCEYEKYNEAYWRREDEAVGIGGCCEICVAAPSVVEQIGFEDIDEEIERREDPSWDEDEDDTLDPVYLDHYPWSTFDWRNHFFRRQIELYATRFVVSRRMHKSIYTPIESEAGDDEGEFWVDFARSLSSSEIVIAPRIGEDTDGESTFSDFDDMSDLVEAIVEIEWDVLSQSFLSPA